jgi:alpha-1,2-mannosyltransferase
MKPETGNLKPEFRNRARIVFLVVIMLAALGALAYEWRNLMVDYVAPLFAGRTGFFADFQFFHDGARRFILSPDELYSGNTRDGFLLIQSAARIDYGYPPTAVLLFAPLATLPLPWAFVVFTAFSAALVLASVLLFRILAREELGELEPRGAWFVLAALVLSLGSVYVTFVFGQVNAVVLVLCLAYVLMARRGQYVWAGLFLAAGFWLKFYPLYLLVLAPFERRPLRLLLSAGLWILAIPVVLLPFLPFHLYTEYFLKIYPELARETAPHVYNQSVTGFLTRLISPKTALFDWGPYVIDSRVRFVNGLATAGLLGWLALNYHLQRERKLLHYACVLAVTPLIVTYGWGGTYMLAIPLVLIVLINALARGAAGFALFAAVWLILLLPAYRPFAFGDRFGVLVEHLYYSRYLYLVLLTVGVVTASNLRRLARDRKTGGSP